jgi:hypothetical protein
MAYLGRRELWRVTITCRTSTTERERILDKLERSSQNVRCSGFAERHAEFLPHYEINREVGRISASGPMTLAVASDGTRVDSFKLAFGLAL